jgi:hypothetical protein
MANIDIATNPTNGVFKDLDKAVTNNVIFRSFINRLETDKLSSSSFVSFIKNIEKSLLTSASFTDALSALNTKNKNILTNERFTGSIEVLRPFISSKQRFSEIYGQLKS